MSQKKTLRRRFVPSVDALDKRDVPSSMAHHAALPVSHHSTAHVKAQTPVVDTAVQARVAPSFSVPIAGPGQPFYHDGAISATFGAGWTYNGYNSYHYDGYSSGTVIVNGISLNVCHIWGDLTDTPSGRFAGNFAFQQTSGPFHYEVINIWEHTPGLFYGRYDYQELGGNITTIPPSFGSLDHEPYNYIPQDDIFNF